MTTVTPPPVRPAAVAGRISYAVLFTIGLPGLLAWWAIELDEWLPLPPYRSPRAGSVLALAGLALMVSAMRDLWVHGLGLPASPFPPQRLVTSGLYRFVRDPIYIGAVAAAFGWSLFAGSPAGLWIVSPTLAMASAAFVIGFERDATTRRLGPTAVPRLRIPESTFDRPTATDRLSVYLLVFLPWLVLYQAVESLGVPPDAVVAYFRWETALPVLPWTEAIYASTYLFVLAGPLVAKRRRDLRAFALGGLWATAIAIPIYLLVPLIAPPRPIPADGFWPSIMQWERAFDQPVTAFPAFHVIWACLAAQLWAAAYSRLTVVWWTLAAAIAGSCITTGLHALVDVAAGLGLYIVLKRRQGLWRAACDGAEWIANAWKELTIGPVRFMVHGMFAAAGAVAGMLISINLAGPASAGWILIVTVAAIVGAGLWGQFVEGSPRLLRPYGYFGSVVGVALVCVAAAISGADGWLLFTAFGVGSAFTQAIGRLRCLTNGCCHGREADASIGIRYTHRRSRVVRLTTLGGIPLHATPVYSAIWMLVVGVVLLRLWALAVPLQFIAGVYFILTGLGRFVEEHYRGEPQTVIVAGLRLYQWVAIAFVVGGAALSTLGADPAPARQSIDPTIIPLVLAVGVIAYFAYGVDFPRSDRRFSRLA
jgi:protein-S-isoprenylcysteine O-methyltransferase Ste14